MKIEIRAILCQHCGSVMVEEREKKEGKEGITIYIVCPDAPEDNYYPHSMWIYNPETKELC